MWALTLKVSEEIATKNDEDCRHQQPRCGLTPAPQRTPVNIRIYLKSLPSFKFMRCTPKNASFLKQCVIAYRPFKVITGR